MIAPTCGEGRASLAVAEKYDKRGIRHCLMWHSERIAWSWVHGLVNDGEHPVNGWPDARAATCGNLAWPTWRTDATTGFIACRRRRHATRWYWTVRPTHKQRLSSLKASRKTQNSHPEIDTEDASAIGPSGDRQFSLVSHKHPSLTSTSVLSE